MAVHPNLHWFSRIRHDSHMYFPVAEDRSSLIQTILIYEGIRLEGKLSSG